MAMFLLILCLLGLVGCTYYTYEYNAKFTLTVKTPEGIKQASSIVTSKVELRDEKHNSWSKIDPSIHIEYSGEAITLDFGNGRVLFVLLPEKSVTEINYDMNYSDFFNGLEPRKVFVPKLQARLDQLKAARTVQMVPPNLYPHFITFDSLTNPTLVRKVDPFNLAATFGPGYAFESFTLTYTDEPVTKGKVMAVLGPHFFDIWDKRMSERVIGFSDSEWEKFQDTFGAPVYKIDFIAKGQ